MVKKVVSLIVGFGLITAGAAGITISLTERDRQAAMKELETARAANQATAAEEQKKIEATRQEIEGKRVEVENLAKSVEAEKKRLETEQRRQEEHLRYKAAVIEEERKAALERKNAPAEVATGKESNKKPIVTTEKSKKGKKTTVASSGSSRMVTANASSLNPRADAINNMGRKAGREAARTYSPVEYYNRATRELLRAEPYDRGHDWVRVRVRVWRDDRLVKDTLVSYSRSSLNEPFRSRA